MPTVRIQDLEMQEENSDHAHVAAELNFRDGDGAWIAILKDGTYEHHVEVEIDSIGKVWLRERPHSGPWDRHKYRNSILLFDSSWEPKAAAPVDEEEPYIDILMMHGPSPKGDFVEVETPDGGSINAGEWIDRGNGYWALRLRARDIARATKEDSNA